MNEQQRRGPGRPAFTEEERTAKRTVDMHIKLPEALVGAIEHEMQEGESRKDCIVRLLSERLGERNELSC